MQADRRVSFCIAAPRCQGQDPGGRGAKPRLDSISVGDTASIQARRTVFVLLADDDEDVRVSGATVLRYSGFSVEVAEDGDEALALLRELDVGVVLLDLKMPRRDGYSVLEALDDPPPVILMSAFRFDKEPADRIGSKVTAHLQKPVSPHRLVPMVAGIVWGST